MITRDKEFDLARRDYESALTRYREAEQALARARSDLNAAERRKLDAWRALPSVSRLTI